MKTKKIMGLAFVALLTIGTAAASGDLAGDSKCNNNGIVIQVSGTGNNGYECEANTMYCDNNTGAGGAAGAGGPSGKNEAGAEVSASGRCQQYNDEYMTCSYAYSEQHCIENVDGDS